MDLKPYKDFPEISFLPAFKVVESVKKFKVACIGSREISQKTSKKLEAIGTFIARKGGVVVSGNAIGSDAAYARGANSINPELVELYVVDRKHNPKFIVPGNKVIYETEENNETWQRIARLYHNRYDKLDDYVQRLMNRNAGIILNSFCTLGVLNHSKSNFGGTGHGWKISEAFKHPRLDIYDIENDNPSLEEVKEFLRVEAKEFRNN